MPLLDNAARRLLEQLRLAVRPRAAGAGQGEHRSEVLASGLEFADHRTYVPGDDVRHVDWKAFARHRQLLLKTFEEERDVRIYLLLDISDSMARGEPPKLDVGRSLCAAFAYLGMKQFDRVHVIPFASGLGTECAPSRTREAFPVLERALTELEPEGVTRFSETTRAFAERHPGHGLVVVISDLMDPADWVASFRTLARLGHELCVVRVGCREDDGPAFRGELELIDAETADQARVRMSPALLEAYKQEVADHVSRCREGCLRVGGRFVEAAVEQPVVELLRTVLAPAMSA